MTNEHHIKKENDKHHENKRSDETKVDEIILEAEQAAQEEKGHLSDDMVSARSAKKIGEKINMALIFILLAVSIIQSIELLNLRNQIEKGQFAAPATGGSQLPSQQGGC